MRLIGNKTHGDLAEIGISEFINQFMYDYKSEHVGKDLYRAKTCEEDILITNLLTNKNIPVSLKAYGDGPLQLSTDKENKLFPLLESYGDDITSKDVVQEILSSVEFAKISKLCIFPLIYRESDKQCNVAVFDFQKVMKRAARIVFVDKGMGYDKKTGKIINKKGRAHPIFLFLDCDGSYICEIRYGGATANALQRGFWTHTVHAEVYFDSLTDGWINYSHNLTLVKLFQLALNSTEKAHEKASIILQEDIDVLKFL